jgi:serine/threonine protein kinase
MQYTDLIEIGRGSYGRVMKCRSESGKLYANKELISKEPKAKDRFIREVEITSKLDHPNIVGVLAKNLQKDPLFYVMKLYAGNLRNKMMQPSFIGNEVEVDKVIKDVLNGLSYAHSQGVAHRDLKPENILHDASGNYVICDFGIGKEYLIERGTQLTTAGAQMGTTQYMAPEQFRNSANIDARADVFAFGKLVIELFTGSIVPGIMSADDIPDKYQYIIGKCLSDKAEKRFKDAGDVKQAFDNLYGIDGIQPAVDRLKKVLSDAVDPIFMGAGEYGQIAAILSQESDQSELHDLIMLLPDISWKSLHDVSPSIVRTKIEEFLSHTSQKSWPFGYTDKLADCYFKIGKEIATSEIRALVICSLYDLAYSHSRWHVFELWDKAVLAFQGDSGVCTECKRRVSTGQWSVNSNYASDGKWNAIFKNFIADKK